MVPLTAIVDVEIGVLLVVLMLRDVVTGLLPEPVVTSGFVAKVAVAPVGSPVAPRVTLQGLALPPTERLTVYAAVLPGATVTEAGARVIPAGFESVNVVVATKPDEPVAVTL